MVEHGQEVAQPSSERPQRVVAAARRRGTVTGKIWCENGVVARKRTDYLPPVLTRAGHPVDEQQQRATTLQREGQLLAVQPNRPRLHHAHSRLCAFMGLSTWRLLTRPPSLARSATSAPLQAWSVTVCHSVGRAIRGSSRMVAEHYAAGRSPGEPIGVCSPSGSAAL